MKRTFLAALILGLAPGAAFPADHYVPNDRTTIQGAIDSLAVAGDNVIITQTNTYAPFLLDKAVTVTTNPGVTATVLATGTQDYAAAISDAGGVIDGLTLKGGDVCIVDVWSGTVRNCTIEDGGTQFTSSAALLDLDGVLEDCTFNLTVGDGIAVKVQDSSTSQPAIVQRNQLNITWSGSPSAPFGIYVDAEAAEILNNDLDLTCPTGYGAGIEVASADGKNSNIYGNTIFGAGVAGMRILTDTEGYVSVTHNSIGDCKYGIYMADGKGHTIENNTIVQSSFTSGTGGIEVNGLATGTAASFKRNLIVNTEEGFDWYTQDTDVTSWTIEDNAFWGDCYIGSTCYPSDDPLATGELRTDYEPLFCDGKDGTAEYSQRIDSIFNPANTSAFTGTLVGALGVECAFGELDRSSIVGDDTEVLVVEDVICPSGKTLTLGENVTFAFDEDDESSRGLSSTLTELIVEGTVTVSGGTGADVTELGSSSSSPTAGDWGGIVVKPGGKLYLTNAHVRDAVTCVRDSTEDPADSITVSSSAFSNFETAAVYVYPSSQNTDGDGELSISSTTIDMDGAAYGIYIKDRTNYEGYGVHLSDVDITGDSNGSYAVYLEMRGDGDVDPVLQDVTVDGLSNGTGIYVADFSPELYGTIIDNCRYGVQFRGTSEANDAPLLRPMSDGTQPEVNNCTTGLYVFSSAADVDSLLADGCVTGVHTDGSAAGDYRDLRIDDCQVGFKTVATGAHKFRSGHILEFTSFGVDAAPGTGGDFGTAADDGLNNIYSSQSPTKYVRIKPLIGATVYAEENWWGTSSPTASWFSTGVDYTPYRSSAYSGGGVRGGAVSVIPLRAYPNPLRHGTSFRFSIPKNVEGAVLEVFDVSGRLVWEWLSPEGATGDQSVAWGGVDRSGTPLSQGIYFGRLRTGAVVENTKIVVLGN